MKKGDTYHNTCDGQPSTWTITHLEGGMVTVYSPQSDKSYTISRVIFEDTMKALGFELVEEKPAKYRVYLNHFEAFTTDEYDTFNQALEYAQSLGFEFKIELGNMVCASWTHLNKLKWTNEYKSWYQDQQSMLAKVEGSYPLP